MSNLKEKGLEALSDDTLKDIAGGFGEGGAISQGVFSSNTGTGLDITVYWVVAINAAGVKELGVSVGANSCTLYCSPIANSVTLNVGGIPYVANNKAINYSGSMAYNELARFLVPNFSGSAQVSASWCFNGSYASQYIGTITAFGFVNA